MRFLIHSHAGTGLGIAYRLAMEGNDVSLFINKKEFRNAGKGLVDHVSTIEEGISKNPDVVIFDMTRYGKLADNLRTQGKKVIAGGELCDLLELDRTYAMNVARKMGIKVPEFHVFKKEEIDKAIELVMETGKRYVFKPEGDSDTSLTYVSKDVEDVIQELEWIRDKNILTDGFLLQEFVEGIEISTEAWFSHGDPISQMCNGTIEQKKFMAGDKGPNTGCESSIVWPYESDYDKIVQKTIRKMYPVIKEYGYSGPIDVNAIISKEDGEPYFLEFTPRFGYSAVYALAELIEGDLGEFFYNIASRNVNDIILKQGVSGAVTISIPPYPLDSEEKMNREAFKKTEGKRVFNMPKEGFWPIDLEEIDGILQTAGGDGLVCYLASYGKTVEEVESNIDSVLEEIEVPDMQYRIDWINRAEKDIPKLASQGYSIPELGEEEGFEVSVSTNGHVEEVSGAMGEEEGE